MRRSYRSFLLVTTSAIAGFAAAGPALAADEPAPPTVPIVEAPTVPDPELPPIPIPEMPPLELVEPVVVTHIDAEDVDVSVRVLSPAEDSTGVQEGATTVISPVSEADITEAAPEADAETAIASEPSALNTNVSIRVLSPGNDGDVTQDNGGSREGLEVEAGPATPRADAAPTSATPAPGASDSSASDSSQYQINNSRYQSQEDSWNWRWLLTLDCAGNASSSSTETGSQNSLVWSWEWAWEWGCADADSNSSNAVSAASSTVPATAEKPPDAQVPSAPETEEASTEPWSWTWTFTFCGETRTITTQGGAGTPLSWAWDWTWTWACGSAARADDAAAPPAIVLPPLAELPAVSSASDPNPIPFLQTTNENPNENPAETLPTVWIPSFPPMVGRDTMTTALVASPFTNLQVTVEIAIPPVVLPALTPRSLPSSVVPFPAVDGTAGQTSASRATAPSARPGLRRSAYAPSAVGQALPATAAHVPDARPRAHHARPAKQPNARSRDAGGTRTPLLPLERRQPGQLAGTWTAGGFASGGILIGFAVLTGFILLAAPGLGRCIRVARELSPRSLEQSPLDRPG